MELMTALKEHEPVKEKQLGSDLGGWVGVMSHDESSVNSK